MFRRLPYNLPQDPVIEPDLDKLGYFVNEHDQIRQKTNPNRKYQYKINRSDRVNDMYKEALNTCSRKITKDRLTQLGMQQLRLPLGASETDKHIPILISKDIREKKHVILLFPERHIECGILSYRVMGEESINKGSVINFVKAVFGVLTTGEDEESSEDLAMWSKLSSIDTPGIVIANPSELIWFRGGSRVVTDREWLALPRKSPIYSAMRIDEEKNRVEGNRDFKEHVQYVLDHIIQSQGDEPQICHPEAKISIIGQEYVGSEALQHLVSNWHIWKERLNCVALINPQHKLEELFLDFNLSTAEARKGQEEIEDFIAQRIRAYKMSQRPLETPLTGRDRFGCNVYAAGETPYEESCFVRCWPSILDWISMCRVKDTYKEPAEVAELSDDEDAVPKTRTYQRKVLNDEEAENAGYHELQIES